MKKNKYILIILIFCVSSNAQTPDLILQDDIDATYISYLTVKELGWLTQVAVGGNDEPTMKAHMGLAIMAFAWSHIDGDTLFTDSAPLLDSIGLNIDTIFARIETNLIPMIDSLQLDYFLDELTNFFDSGDYVAFRDFLSQTITDLDSNIENLEFTIDDFLDDLGNNFADQYFSDHLGAIFDSTADFSFSLQILATDFTDTTFVFSRNYFDHLTDIADLADSISYSFEQFGGWMDSVMSISGADVMPGIAHFRTGLSDLDELTDTLKIVLISQPFAPFEIDPSPLDSFQQAISELDSLLDGKEYEYNSDYEGYSIRPLAIIQNMPGDGLADIYWDFYRTVNPESYTFGGIFPYGLDPQSLDLLSPDMIINDNDESSDMDLRLTALEMIWQAQLLTEPDNPDTHLGLALVLTHNTINDHIPIFEDIFCLLDEGRIDSLTYLYNWDSIDLSDDIDQVDYHLDYFTNADQPTHFVVLVKTSIDSYGPYTIGPDSEFEIVNLPVPLVAFAQMNLNLAWNGIELIVQGIADVYSELSDIFILELDPTILDFSTIESDTDLVLLLEQSNPDFLSLTPYGINRFIEAGDAIEDGLSELNGYFNQLVDLAVAMQPYEEDFAIDGAQFIADMIDMEAQTFELWQDFAFPDSVTIIDDERVNLSAWFDNPPASFLIMWKNLVFAVDSTMGGLFPDRPTLGIEAGKFPVVPRTFSVHHAYPNPFNPATLISFDIPKAGKVNVAIYNLLGEKIVTLVDQEMTPGWKRIPWHAGLLPSGIYFYRVSYDRQRVTNKLMFIK